MVLPEIIDALKKCELFSTADEAHIERIAELCSIKEYQAGETVFAQGEFKTDICLIAEGQVALVRSVNLGGREGERTIEVLGKGRGMGWSSILCEPCSASASAVCQKPTRIVSLNGSSLRELLNQDAELGFMVMDRLAHVLGHRLRAAYGAMDTFK